MISTIVVGVDGSEGSAHAAEWATRLAQTTGAEVVAVGCYSWNPLVGDATNEEIVADRRKDLDDVWTEPMRTAGVLKRARLEVGDARVMLLEAAATEQADLIVVGSRGHSALTEIMLGSVAYWVTHHSTVPVVVVPATAD